MMVIPALSLVAIVRCSSRKLHVATETKWLLRTPTTAYFPAVTFHQSVKTRCHWGVTQRVRGHRAKAKLVIFDNNGTLTNFHPVWTPWVQDLTNRLESFTGVPLRARIYASLSVCPFTEKTRDGVLAERTCAEIQRRLVAVLSTAPGVTPAVAALAVAACWRERHVPDVTSLQPVTDLTALFMRLKRLDIQIAICTSGSRCSTLHTLQVLQLSSLVSTVMCGDDAASLPKPDPRNIVTICDRLKVSPCQTVMVGDTAGDMRMATRAGVGLAVGVLSGVSTRLQLSAHTPHIVASVAALPVLLAAPLPRRPPGGASGRGERGAPASLVIFDKDGTLLCFHSMWTPWLRALVGRLEEVTGLDLNQKVSRALGYDVVARRWRPGIFAEGTGAQNRQRLRETLCGEGLTSADASEVVAFAWRDADHTGADLRPLHQPTALFKTLQSFGIKVAICTADSRRATCQFVSAIGAQRYVDAMSCGDDADSRPKPSPHNALRLCRLTDVPPRRAVVVGDTMADIGMGRAAGVGATVGVLSGVGGATELGRQADHVVASVAQLLPLVLTERQHRQVSQSGQSEQSV